MSGIGGPTTYTEAALVNRILNLESSTNSDNAFGSSCTSKINFVGEKLKALRRRRPAKQKPSSTSSVTDACLDKDNNTPIFQPGGSESLSSTIGIPAGKASSDNHRLSSIASSGTFAFAKTPVRISITTPSSSETHSVNSDNRTGCLTPASTSAGRSVESDATTS